jgi:hypothetical protein
MKFRDVIFFCFVRKLTAGVAPTADILLRKIKLHNYKVTWPIAELCYILENSADWKYCTTVVFSY